MSQAHIGVQVGAHSVFDEGPEQLVELLAETCQATALHVYAMTGHQYAPWFVASGQSLTAESARADHGCRLQPRPQAPLTSVWFQSDPRFYQRPEQAPAQRALGYGDRDVFAELAEPAARAGMALYARFCDWGNVLPFVPGMMDWSTVDRHGIRQPYLCPNHPGYRRWMRNLVEDLFRNRPYLAGLNFGFERGAPLLGVIAGNAGDCFCEHCCSLAARRGVSAERARDGFAALGDWGAACRAGEIPVDGAFTSFFRILRSQPEVLAWDKQMTDGWFAIAKDLYATIKAIDPRKQVGWHIFQHLSFNPLFRAIFDGAELAPFSDWLKPVLYHNCWNSRMRDWALEPLGRSLFADLPAGLLEPVLQAMLGYADSAEAGPDRSGFDPARISSEVSRLRRSSGRPILAGIGLDIPDVDGAICTPSSVRSAVEAAFAGGASGVVVSREYDEMQLANLAAVGDAVRAAGSGRVPAAAGA